jgi:hypothetical protein
MNIGNKKLMKEIMMAPETSPIRLRDDRSKLWPVGCILAIVDTTVGIRTF